MKNILFLLTFVYCIYFEAFKLIWGFIKKNTATLIVTSFLILSFARNNWFYFLPEEALLFFIILSFLYLCFRLMYIQAQLYESNGGYDNRRNHIESDEDFYDKLEKLHYNGLTKDEIKKKKKKIRKELERKKLV